MFAALVLVSLLGPLSIHLFVPVLPFVRQSFGVDAETAQLSVSLSMLCMAATTPLYGTFADRYGRLPVLLLGIGLFTCGAAAAGFAQSIEALIIGRMIQGAGAGCGLVLARAIARDVYGAERLGKMISYLTAAMVLGPMFGPPLGGWLTDMFGWAYDLAVPASFGVLTIIIIFTVIGETKPKDLLPPANVITGYYLLLRNPRFVCFALNPAINSGVFFALNSSAVYLMVETLGTSAVDFGLWFMLGPVGYMAANCLAGRLSNRFSSEQQVIFGSAFSLCGSLALPGLVGIMGITPESLFITSLIISFGQGFSNPHAQAIAIAVDDTLAGTASGIVVFFYLLVVAGLTQLVSLATPGSVTLLVGTMMIAGSVAFLLGLLGGKFYKRT